MAISPNQLTAKIEEQNLLTRLSGVPVRLDQVVAKDRTTTVIAESIIVSGIVRTDGKDLNLICRELVFENGSIIDASGLQGLPDYPEDQRPEGPHELGANGADGGNGGDGKHGGTVTITADIITGIVNINANGGQGGRGQDGGNGQKGGPGPNGSIETEHRTVASNAHDGYNGGASGLPGMRGSGGKGGVITINTVQPFHNEYHTSVLAGIPGTAAQPGYPGDGGDPGQPGRCDFSECVDIGVKLPLLKRPHIPLHPGGDPSRIVGVGMDDMIDESTHGLLMAAVNSHLQPTRIWCRVVKSESGNPANIGPTGDKREKEVAIRQAMPVSLDGKVDIAPIQKEDFAQKFTGPVLDLLTIAIEDEYRQQGASPGSDLARRIAFIFSICLDDPTQDKHKTEVLGRGYAMARKASLGLDFYGYSKENAPLLSFESYSNLVKETVLPTAAIVEDAFNRFKSEENDINKKVAALTDSLKVVQQHQANVKNESERISKEAAALQNSISAMDKQIEAAKNTLKSVEESLNAAIKAKSENCNLVNAFTAVATIVVGVASGGAGFIAAASAGAKLFKDASSHDNSLKNVWDNRLVLQDDLQEIAKDVTTVVDAVQTISENVKKLTPDQRKLPQFRMERDTFDKVAIEYAELPEAEYYKEAGYAYLKAVETRNQTIIDYNSSLTRLIEYQANIYAQERIAAGIESAIHGQTDPAGSVVWSLLCRYYSDTLSQCAAMVHAERKALSYTFAEPATAPVSALNVGTIAAAHQRAQLIDWATAKENFRAKRELSQDGLILDIKKLIASETWTAFCNGDGLGCHALQFVIRRDNPDYQPIFENLPGLRITGVGLTLPGASSNEDQTQIGWHLVQGGCETIYKANGSAVNFSHRPIRFSGFTSLSQTPPILRPDFSEQNLYAGVSPFAMWLLEIDSNPRLGLNLSKLATAKLIIHGYMIEG